MNKVLSVSVFLFFCFGLSGCEKPQKPTESIVQESKDSDTIKLNLSKLISSDEMEAKTRFGLLAFKQDDTGVNGLYLNDKKIYPIEVDEQPIGCSNALKDLYQTSNEDVFIVSEFCGGSGTPEGDGGNFTLTISSNGKPVISDSYFDYERNNVKTDGKKIIITQTGIPHQNKSGQMVKNIQAIYENGSVRIITEAVSEKELSAIKESSCHNLYDIYKDFVFEGCESGSACSVGAMSTERVCYSSDLGDDIDNKMTSAGNMACKNKSATLAYPDFMSSICGLR